MDTNKILEKTLGNALHTAFENVYNEGHKQGSKETALKLLTEIRGYYPGKKENCNKGELFIIELCEDLAKDYGIVLE